MPSNLLFLFHEATLIHLYHGVTLCEDSQYYPSFLDAQSAEGTFIPFNSSPRRAQMIPLGDL